MTSQIKKIIAESDLNPEEQKELLSALKPLSGEDMDELAVFLNKYPEWVKKLYENYKDKKAAGSSLDLTKWRAIINKEKEDLEKLAL